jgi:hypothetical protein
MSLLADLQQWYQAQCNEDWEHHFGVSIGTLDNPGWIVTIDLEGTDLKGKPFQEIKDIEPEREWIHCRVEDAKFQGAGGPQKLEQILQTFLSWTKAV